MINGRIPIGMQPLALGYQFELIESIPNEAGAIRFEGFIPQGINAESLKFHLRNGKTQRLGRQSGTSV
jgi:hypothetical protein